MSNDKQTTDDADWQAAAYEQFLRDDADADLVYEEEWAAEVERRQAEVESGAARFLSGPETLAQLKSDFE